MSRGNRCDFRNERPFTYCLSPFVSLPASPDMLSVFLSPAKLNRYTKKLNFLLDKAGCVKYNIRKPLDVKVRLERQEKKILKLTTELEVAKVETM